MNQQEERNCVAVSCSSCFLKLSMFCIKKTLNFKEACLYMGLSKSQLYKLAKNGHIPHYRPSGKLLYFNKQELDEWLCRNQVEETEKSSPKEMPDNMNEYVEPNKQFAS